MDFVGDGSDQPEQEVTRCCCPAVLMEFDERELAGAIDYHEPVELASLGADFRHVDLEVADGICAELAALGLGALDLDLGQPQVVVPL